MKNKIKIAQIILLAVFISLPGTMMLAEESTVDTEFDVLSGELYLEAKIEGSTASFQAEGAYKGEVHYVTNGETLDAKINAQSHSPAQFVAKLQNPFNVDGSKEVYMEMFSGGGSGAAMNASFFQDSDGNVTVQRKDGKILSAQGTADNYSNGWGYLMSMVNEVRSTEDTENKSASVKLQIAGDGEANVDHPDSGYFGNIDQNGDSFVFSIPSFDNPNINVTGYGQFTQEAEAEKNLEMNGISLSGGGSLTISGEFNDGMSQKMEVEAEGNSN
ncbi:hypothetical protein KGY79_05950 [Candidatus Bipolaricaulota bacterium]|nr:hypothetical protein [Candidatus Bipolaricaulota bacterium]